MKTYTEYQLVTAQTKYNEEFKSNPEKFESNEYIFNNPAQAAQEQIDYLIKIIEDEKL